MKVKWLTGLKPPPVGTAIYRDATSELQLFVSTRGTMTWVFQYSFVKDGKRLQPRLTLGYYPSLGLAEARQKARDARAAVDAGVDPGSMVTLARPLPPSIRPAPAPPPVGVEVTAETRRLLGFGEAPVQPESFGALAAAYLVHHVQANKVDDNDDARHLRNYLLPYWRNEPVRAFTRRMVHDRIDAIAERGSESPWVTKQRDAGKYRPTKPAPVQANRIQSLVSALFSFALDRGWTDAHPAIRMKKRKEKSRERWLTREEVITVWQLAEQDDDPICAAALLLQLFVGQRPSMVLQAEWDEFDVEEGWWTVPATRKGNKRRVPHRVPLGPLSVQLLEELRAAGYHSRLLFPHRGRGGWRTPGFFEAVYDVLTRTTRPMTTAEITVALRARGFTLGRRAELRQSIGCELSRRAKAATPLVQRTDTGWQLTGLPCRGLFGDGPISHSTTSYREFTDRVCKRLGFTLHDLRHTMTTHLARLKVPKEHRSKLLHHAPPSTDITSRVYDQYEYDAEKAAAMAVWHRELRAWHSAPKTPQARPRLVEWASA